VSKQTLQLVFRMEVETSATDPATTIEIIEDINNQVSGQLREIQVHDGKAHWNVDYQVVAMHGQKDR
jgi:hypothetical protein